MPTDIEKALSTLRNNIELLDDREGGLDKEAALATGGVPVYVDMGGVLTITSDGRVQMYDPETRSVSVVVDEKWRRVAFASASSKYPTLALLKPQRSDNARDCRSCDGTGRFGSALCMHCCGLGWVE
jgi:hypothetical protein